MTLRYDAVALDRAEETPEGWIRDRPVLTRTGVFEYRRADGTTRREYRPPEEVFHADHLASLRGVPVTVEHPGVVTAENPSSIVGASISAGEQRGDDVIGEIVIHNPRALGARRELSLGYRVRLDETPGVTPSGERYDAIQRGLAVNHIAVVPKGRAGNARLRLDAADAISTTIEEGGMPDNLVAVRLDGISYQAAPEVARHIERLEADLAAARTRADTAEAARDAATTRADAAEASVATARTEAAQAARERVALEARAKEVGAEFKADASDRAIREAIVRKVQGDAIKLDGKSDDYVNAACEIALSTAQRADSHAAAQVTAATPMPAGNGAPRITSAAAASELYRRTR